MTDFRYNIAHGFYRDPPCSRCGLVEPMRAFVTKRHTCNPTSVQAMQIGVDNVERIGRAIRDAFEELQP